MDAVLQRFARDTRQPWTPQDRTALARKWMALQVASSGETAPLLYSYIGNDYRLLALRNASVMHPPKAIDATAFVEICQQGFSHTKSVEHEKDPADLIHFRDTVFPIPVGQELWVDSHRTNHWVERAYFLASQRPASYDLVSAIHNAATIMTESQRNSRANKDSIADTFTRINAYRMPSKSLTTTGQLLQQLDLHHVTNEVDMEIDTEIEGELQGGPSDAVAREAYLREREERDQAPVNSVMTFVGDQVAEPTTLTRSPAMQEYAQATLLNAVFPAKRIAKQMLLLQLGLPVDASLLARNQTIIPTTLATPALETDAVRDLFASTADLSQLDRTSTPVQLVYEQCARSHPEGVTPATFIATVLDVYQPETSSSSDDNSMWKRQIRRKYPNPDPSIVQCILDV